MTKKKAILSKADHKELLNKVHVALETNLSFLQNGLNEKKWARNIKKASKLLVEDYKQPKEETAVVVEKKISPKTASENKSVVKSPKKVKAKP